MCHVRPRCPAALLLALLLLGSSVAASAWQTPSGRRANARKLLRISDGASQRLIQAGRGRLDQDARSRPFWEALLRMDAQIDRVGAGLKTRDLSFFQDLRSGTASLAELQVTWALAGVKDPAVDQNLRVLSAAYGRLRTRYGPEWVRFQTGRPLSEDERVRFQRLRAEQSFLAGKLAPLRDQAEQAGDSATAHELTLLLVHVHGVATASPTLGDYLDASVATDSIRGAWYGARAAHATDKEGWAEADQVVSDITTDENVGFVFTSDLREVKDWSFVEVETEIPAEIAQAEESEGSELAPGEIVELGPVEAPEMMVLEEGPAEVVESEEVWSEDPAETTAPEEGLPQEAAAEEVTEEQDIEPEAEDLDPLGPDSLPVDETIEEEDLDVLPPGEGPPPLVEPSPPPPTVPGALPIG
jgi:hypothetical protein